MGLRVRIYFDSTRKAWSIKYKGKVIGKALELCLTNVKFVASEKGRQRVLKSGRKNVHSYVEGVVTSPSLTEEVSTNRSVFSYNPYRGSKFFKVANGDPIEEAPFVSLNIIEGRTYCWATYL